jgi:hypothetical protein
VEPPQIDLLFQISAQINLDLSARQLSGQESSSTPHLLGGNPKLSGKSANPPKVVFREKYLS